MPKQTMPQMDITWFASQIFWLTVTFVFLYVVLARFILPRIHDILESRKDRIDHDLSRASQMKEEAEEIRTAYDKALADARTKAQSLLATSSHQSATVATAKQAELDAVINNKLTQSEATLMRARKDVMERLSPVAQELTSLIVEKLVNYKPSNDQLASVVDKLSRQKQA